MGKYLADSYDAALRENADLKTRLAEAVALLRDSETSLRYASKCMNPLTPAARWWVEAADRIKAFLAKLEAKP